MKALAGFTIGLVIGFFIAIIGVAVDSGGAKPSLKPEPHECVPVGHDWSFEPCQKHPHDPKTCLGCETRKIVERHFEQIRSEASTLAIPNDPPQPRQYGLVLKRAK